MERIAITLQINEFGQTPRQLFKAPHPPRYDLKAKILAAPRRISTATRIKSEDPEAYNESGFKDEIEESKMEENDVQQDALYLDGSPKEKGARKMSKLPEEVPDSLWEAKGLDKLEIQQVQKVHKG